MRDFTRHLGRLYDRYALTLLTVLLSACLVAVVIWPLSVVQIDSGYAGVLWRRFGGGTDMNITYSEGTHFIFPWDAMYRYNIRVSNLKVDMNVLFPDDLSAQTQFTLVYRPIPDQLNIVHRYYGPDFESTYLRPLFIREINNAIKDFGDITKVPVRRGEVETTIMEKLLADLSVVHPGEPRGLKFFVHNVIIGEMQVPAEVSKMIEQKNAERERGEAYVYRIQNEVSEADRKRIEAQGILDFQKIIGEALTDNYLKLEGIRATRDLALSNNSKIVVFGNRSWGLPMLLDEQDTQALPQANAAAAPLSKPAAAATPAPAPDAARSAIPLAAEVEPKTTRMRAEPQQSARPAGSLSTVGAGASSPATRAK